MPPKTSPLVRSAAAAARSAATAAVFAAAAALAKASSCEEYSDEEVSNSLLSDPTLPDTPVAVVAPSRTASTFSRMLPKTVIRDCSKFVTISVTDASSNTTSSFCVTFCACISSAASASNP